MILSGGYRSMGVYKIFFSPTYSTKEVVNIVGDVFGKSASIDLSIMYEKENFNFCENDLCIVGVPSYGGRVPKVVLERMDSFKGNGAKAILITTYGNRAYEDTLLELQDFMEEHHFHCIAAIASVAQHSVFPKFAKGRPDVKDREELTLFAHRIQENQNGGVLKVPGHHPYKEYNGIPLKPKATSDCKLCGKCASVCPVRAISREHPNQTDKNICISCMRCINICPTHSRTLNPLLSFVASKKLEKVCKTSKSNELFLMR